MKKTFSLFFMLVAFTGFSQTTLKLQAKVDQQAKDIEKKVIEWRRHLHEFPELSNRETNTGKYLSDYLKSLGLEVQYPVAKTGVVAILKGSQPGPVVALRADMDALPVTERNGLSFLSKQRSTFGGIETGVMHACGHDSHMAILMGVAEILSKDKADIKGTVKFIFQPAEEGPPEGEEGGASLMIKEGVMDNPKVDVVFGLHIQSLLPTGQIAYRAEGLMAAEDAFTISVKGTQAHGATPWDSVDPVSVSGQIITAMQTIVSRQTDLTKAPVVLTIGSVHGGIRSNIIPEEVIMQGTLRTFDKEMRRKVIDKLTLMVSKIAEASGAKATLTMGEGFPVVYNDIRLTEVMAPTLSRVSSNIKITVPVTMAEDFAFFQEKAPGLFFFLGAYPADMKLTKAPVHHTPDFMLDERAFVTGVKALTMLTLDYMYLKK